MKRVWEEWKKRKNNSRESDIDEREVGAGEEGHNIEMTDSEKHREKAEKYKSNYVL